MFLAFETTNYLSVDLRFHGNGYAISISINPLNEFNVLRGLWTYEQIEIRIWLMILRKASDCYANFMIYVDVTVIYIYK